MKEFIVLYTLENDVKREKIVKELSVEKEEVFQEVLGKIEKNHYLIVKDDQEDFLINTSQIRYIRVKAEQMNSNHHTLKNI